MNITNLNLANSSLQVNPSGCDANICHDLNLPDGKSIAELLQESQNEQKEETN